MKDNDLTPKTLAGLVLGESPANFMAFRILEDVSSVTGENKPAGCVVVDHAGRKFVLSQADLDRERERVVTSRLQARGRALVEDIAASLQSTLPDLKPAAKGKPKTAPKPSPSPMPAGKPATAPRPVAGRVPKTGASSMTKQPATAPASSMTKLKPTSTKKQ